MTVDPRECLSRTVKSRRQVAPWLRGAFTLGSAESLLPAYHNPGPRSCPRAVARSTARFWPYATPPLTSKGRSILATAWDVVREPMFLLLLACGTIYLILGDVQEAVMLLGFVFVVLGITLYQERKTERALEAA
jgi:hypothetical protein